jgi:HAD superfamily hydrolase (TIGR01509 family)
MVSDQWTIHRPIIQSSIRSQLLSGKPLAMKKYILFDHDGVLVDTEYWYFTANKRALAELGIELELALYLQNMTQGISAWDLATAQGVDEAAIERQRAQRDLYYQEYLQNEDIEIPGVAQALRGLSTHYRMAIITTAKRVDFELIHRHRNIVQYMDFVLTREDYDQAKPEPEPYLTGLAKFGGRPEEALVVEDSERGLRSAVAAGIECAIVHNEFTKTHDFSTATYRIGSLDELAALLHA